jgi:hypothetical protein
MQKSQDAPILFTKKEQDERRRKMMQIQQQPQSVGVGQKAKTKHPQDTRMRIRLAFEVIRRRILELSPSGRVPVPFHVWKKLMERCDSDLDLEEFPIETLMQEYHDQGLVRTESSFVVEVYPVATQCLSCCSNEADRLLQPCHHIICSDCLNDVAPVHTRGISGLSCPYCGKTAKEMPISNPAVISSLIRPTAKDSKLSDSGGLGDTSHSIGSPTTQTRSPLGLHMLNTSLSFPSTSAVSEISPPSATASVLTSNLLTSQPTTGLPHSMSHPLSPSLTSGFTPYSLNQPHTGGLSAVMPQLSAVFPSTVGTASLSLSSQTSLSNQAATATVTSPLAQATGLPSVSTLPHLAPTLSHGASFPLQSFSQFATPTTGLNSSAAVNANLSSADSLWNPSSFIANNSI